MARAAVELQWMARASALTATPVESWQPNAVSDATATAVRLVGSARRLVATADEAGDDPRLRRLAEVLAAAPVSAAMVDGPVDCGAFAALLREAGLAVYVCRTLLHPSGTCLFGSAGDGSPRCGQILAATHHALQ